MANPNGAEALDIIGYCVLNPGSVDTDPANQCYIPLLRGSRFVENPSLEVEDAAMGLPESGIWTQGVTMPALLVRAPVYGGATASLDWFTAKRLNLGLLPDTAADGTTPWGTAGSRTGLIKQSLGSVQYALADAGDGGPIEHAGCKMANFRLDWNAQDGVIATFMLMMLGARAGTPTPLVSTVGAGQPPTGPYFMSQGVTYAGTVSEVISGSLSINTRLQPDVSTPLGTAPDATTGVSYPNDYFNDGSPRMTLTLTQKKGATTVVAPSDEQIGTLQVVFADKGGAAGTNKVAFTLKNLKGVVERATGIQLARITRTYSNVKPDNSATAFSIAIA